VKRWFLLGGVVLFAFVAFGIYRAGFDEIVPRMARDADRLVARGGQLYGRRVKSRSWAASYDRIESNADQTIVDIYGVHDGVIFKKGRPALHVTAQHMTVNLVTHDFTVLGPMHAETIGKAKRREIDTDAAMWSEATGSLTFPKRVVFHNEADAPLTFTSATYNVRTGDVDVHDVAGGMR